eukprot:COSAG01_NODE_7915_length_2994_cov_16.350604_2_plen_83_part_00
MNYANYYTHTGMPSIYPSPHIHHTPHPHAPRNPGSISPWKYVQKTPASTPRSSPNALIDLRTRQTRTVHRSYPPHHTTPPPG